MTIQPLRTAAFAAFMLAGIPAAHAACDTDKDGTDLTGPEAQAIYDCLKDSLYAGYQKGNKRWIPKEIVSDYRDWVPASRFPAAPGFHGGRFLMTFVTENGAGEYKKYKDADVQIPAGTLIAKESFSVNDTGKVSPGPLFIMEKTEAGKSPETMDWFYMMVAPNGTPMAVNVISACSECHMGNFGEQGGLGYPVEDARITN